MRGLESANKRGYSMRAMKLKRLSIALLSGALALAAGAAPLRALPPKAKACCGPSCPEPKPKAPPTCCEISPAQAPASAVAAPAPLLLIVAHIAPEPVVSDTRATFVLSAGSDRAPPQRHRLASSGLSPPSLS